MSKFVLFSVSLVAVLVLVAVPFITGPIVTSAVRDAGLQGEDLEVSVDLLGLSILSGRAPAVHVQGQQVAVPRAVIGRVDLTLRNVSVSDRSFESVSGHLDDVRVSGPGGVSFTVDTIDLDGPADATHARGHLGAASAGRLVQQVARDAGITVENVRFHDHGLTFERGGRSVEATLRVAGAALILDEPGRDAAVLVAPPPSESWSLDSVRVSEDGLRIDITVDANDLADQVSGANEGP